jgi:hypothetical protein
MSLLEIPDLPKRIDELDRRLAALEGRKAIPADSIAVPNTYVLNAKGEAEKEGKAGPDTYFQREEGEGEGVVIPQVGFTRLLPPFTFTVGAAGGFAHISARAFVYLVEGGASSGGTGCDVAILLDGQTIPYVFRGGTTYPLMINVLRNQNFLAEATVRTASTLDSFAGGSPGIEQEGSGGGGGGFLTWQGGTTNRYIPFIPAYGGDVITVGLTAGEHEFRFAARNKSGDPTTRFHVYQREMTIAIYE